MTDTFPIVCNDHVAVACHLVILENDFYILALIGSGNYQALKSLRASIIKRDTLKILGATNNNVIYVVPSDSLVVRLTPDLIAFDNRFLRLHADWDHFFVLGEENLLSALDHHLRVPFRLAWGERIIQLGRARGLITPLRVIGQERLSAFKVQNAPREWADIISEIAKEAMKKEAQ
jgi:hypothetical protein